MSLLQIKIIDMNNQSHLQNLINQLCPCLPTGRPSQHFERITSSDLMPENKNSIWYVYVLECENGALYKGFTTNIKQRYIKHISILKNINQPLYFTLKSILLKKKL